VRARDIWRNAIVKIDELSVKMEDIYDDFDDGIQAVEESMEDNQDFILNLANEVASHKEGENEDGIKECRHVDQNSVHVFNFPNCQIQNTPNLSERRATQQSHCLSTSFPWSE